MERIEIVENDRNVFAQFTVVVVVVVVVLLTKSQMISKILSNNHEGERNDSSIVKPRT